MVGSKSKIVFSTTKSLGVLRPILVFGFTLICRNTTQKPDQDPKAQASAVCKIWIGKSKNISEALPRNILKK